MPSTTTKQLILESVRAQFARWRQTRDKMIQIPEFLWDKVFSLIGHYSMGKVLSTFSIKMMNFPRQL